MIPLAVLAAGAGALLVLSGLRGQSVGNLLRDALSGTGGASGGTTGTGTTGTGTGTTGTGDTGTSGTGTPRGMRRIVEPPPDRGIVAGGEGTDDDGTGTSRSLADLDPLLSRPLARLISDARAAGYDVSIISGRRTRAKQEKLWREALAKYGDPEIADNHVARPGTSRHERGLAADLGYSAGAQTWVHANASRYGLWFRMAWEPWHIEPRRIT